MKTRLKLVSDEPTERVFGSRDHIHGDCASRTDAGQASPGAAARLRHPVTITYRGPSETFLRRRFNPDAPHSPERFEPTEKQPGDIVL